MPLLRKRSRHFARKCSANAQMVNSVRLGSEQPPSTRPSRRSQHLVDFLKSSSGSESLTEVDLHLRLAIREDQEIRLAGTRGSRRIGRRSPSRRVRPRARRACAGRTIHELGDGVPALERRDRSRGQAAERLEVGAALLGLFVVRAHATFTSPRWTQWTFTKDKTITRSSFVSFVSLW